jgi:hypothetical protein
MVSRALQPDPAFRNVPDFLKKKIHSDLDEIIFVLIHKHALFDPNYRDPTGFTGAQDHFSI